jgi:hypothetical protein
MWKIHRKCCVVGNFKTIALLNAESALENKAIGNILYFIQKTVKKLFI